ncbi:MAG: hypothetical protein ACE5K4_00180 [Candidatus Hydrothermarchaeota archaeon]
MPILSHREYRFLRGEVWDNRKKKWIPIHESKMTKNYQRVMKHRINKKVALAISDLIMLLQDPLIDIEEIKVELGELIYVINEILPYIKGY